METLFAASGNAGKLRDFAEAAELFGVQIRSLPGLGAIAPPAEDGATFEENARIKAIFYSLQRPGALVVADDSGLAVDALGGAPGVRSARFAADAGVTGPLAADALNNQHLLALLEGVTLADRTARYHCVLAAARNGAVAATAHGTVEGTILAAPLGEGGFGYDPLFFLPELGRTMAQVDLKSKQRFSHRGRALAALLGVLDAEGGVLSPHAK